MRMTNPIWRVPLLLAALLLSVLPYCEAGITVGTLTIEKEARIGESYGGTITLANDGNEFQEVIIYQTDYLYFSDGSNQYGDAGTLERSNADWITFSPSQLEVPPHESSQVSYEINVPEDSSLIGTYWSLLMVEEVNSSTNLPSDLHRNQAGVRQVIRYGIQCITHIGETGHHRLSFTGAQLVVGENEEKELQVDVENVGERWAVPIAWMELYDTSGRHVGRFESEKRRIFPGTSVRFRIHLSSVHTGKYKALVVLDNGDRNVLGAKYDLEF